MTARPLFRGTGEGPGTALSCALHVQINFFIFIRILHILMAKLRAHQMRYTDYKFRWVHAVLGPGWGGDTRTCDSASTPTGWPSPR